MVNNQHKTIPVRIPTNLDCESLAEGHNLDFKYNPDKVKFIVNYLIEQMSWNKRLFESKQVPFIELHSKQIKQYVPDYQKYVQLLIDKDVLVESSINYSAGRFSRSYQLTTAYRTQTKDDFIRDTKFISSIYTRTEKESQEAIQLHPHLTKWLSGLEIDSSLARQWAEHNLAARLLEAKTPVQMYKAYMSHANCFQSIARISRGYNRMIVDTKGHRLHHVLTNMKSDLRNALTYNGQPLVNLDLSSSQVYLMLALGKSSFYSQKKERTQQIHITDLAENVQQMIGPVTKELIIMIEMITTPFKPDPKSEPTQRAKVQEVARTLNTWFDNLLTQRQEEEPEELETEDETEDTTQQRNGSRELNRRQGVCFPMCVMSDDSYMCEEFSNPDLAACNRPTALEDWNTLRSQVEGGQFYEHMISSTTLMKPTWKASRSQMKATIFSVLFSSNHSKNPVAKGHKELFRSLFPSVYSLLRVLKSQDHSTLALLLQNIESNIFLSRVTKRISIERPDIPLFTIHDSVATTVGNESFVESIMKDELYKAIGARPFIKREY